MALAHQERWQDCLGDAAAFSAGLEARHLCPERHQSLCATEPMLEATQFRTWSFPHAQGSWNKVPGLHDVMRDAGLSSYELVADRWCHKMGAAFLEELVDCSDELCDAICDADSPAESSGSRSRIFEQRLQRLRRALFAPRAVPGAVVSKHRYRWKKAVRLLLEMRKLGQWTEDATEDSLKSPCDQQILKKVKRW
eukprot:TRINITY_DN11626_c0_g1_i1.p1 TRINITY_DN11626_c0_g1~~TRINITY_DN11626_c0_g1_i1.p1  ORF type:complete len:195 (-),score=46.22 TRINITY_DN11626_c0_g1_i1:378-962(-)